jgi:hypothetical protein
MTCRQRDSLKGPRKQQHRLQRFANHQTAEPLLSRAAEAGVPAAVPVLLLQRRAQPAGQAGGPLLMPMPSWLNSCPAKMPQQVAHSPLPCLLPLLLLLLLLLLTQQPMAVLLMMQQQWGGRQQQSR